VPALKIASGLVHKLPPDLRTSLASDPQAFATWEDISSIARNEWICWIESAKKSGDENPPHRAGNRESIKRKTTTLLLAWLSTSLNPQERGSGNGGKRR
jgi:hypothetical protein